MPPAFSRTAAPPRGAITTLLLDLDGTLLDIDMPAFLEAFFPLAASRFAPPARSATVAHAMAAAARAMFSSRGKGSLDQVFLEGFAAAAGCGPDEARARLEDFYREGLETLRPHAGPMPGARRALERFGAAGLRLVLATNPVFMLGAIRARVRWAGLDDVPFLLVTSAEIMRRTKPHREYFLQTLELAGARADECLMVGDNRTLDLAARGAGIGTWLAVPPGHKPPESSADQSGTLEQLADWLTGSR